MRVLSEASEIVRRKWRNRHTAWKVTLVIGLILRAILAVVGLALWLVGRLIRSLAAGGFENRDSYIPRVRR